MSDCKINGTETSILNSITQILRTLPNISKVNYMAAGKSHGKVYAAKRFNKFNLNMDEMLYAFSKLKSIEMMYGVELTISVASISEMQRRIGDSNLNNYIKVASEHPSDTDDIGFRLYNYLWVITSVKNASSLETNVVLGEEKITEENIPKKTKRKSRKKTHKTTRKTTQKTTIVPSEPVSDSEDIMPRESLTSNSCNKCNYIYEDDNVYECKDSVCNETEDKHYICEQCADVCEECNKHVCFGGHMKYGMQTCGECYYER